MQPDPDLSSLKRSLTLPLVTLYGLGNILGAGIYVLIGKVAGEAGFATPHSFLLASLIAGITAFSYAELASRFPLSAGEAVYVQEGLRIRKVSVIVGILIIATGIASAATITRGFVGYLQIFIQVPDNVAMVTLLVLLGSLAAWGITQSVATAAIFTLLEVVGLFLILGVTLPEIPQYIPRANSAPDIAWTGIIGGAFLAFYAYVGFEDIVNIAEEVKRPRRNLPLAILLALGLATLLYVFVAVAALSVVSPAVLRQSEAPLATVYQSVTGSDPWLISFISMFAVVIGGLIQIIMSSRVCYGMSQQGWLPSSLGRINRLTRTPLLATALVTGLVTAGALWLPIETLARTTTTLLLFIFILINLSLARIKLDPKRETPDFQVPLALPILGFVVSLGFLLAQLIAYNAD